MRMQVLRIATALALLLTLFILAACEEQEVPKRRKELVSTIPTVQSTEVVVVEPTLEPTSVPQMIKVREFYLVSEETTCLIRELEPCGMLFYKCNNNTVYRCMINARYKPGERSILDNTYEEGMELILEQE